jgi:polyisoprenoid-binding protein YceI
MARWPYADDDLRAMYAGGRGNPTARRYARFWAVVHSAGLFPRRWVTLEVVGRRSGRVTRFPLGMADLEGNRYLVSMLGEDCNWVRNVRAADGLATIRRGRARPCRLVEVPVEERAPILARYLRKVPGARPHIPVDRDAPLAEFEAVAARYPVFRVEPDMTAVTSPQPPVPTAPGQPRRKRHWLRWTVAVAATLVVLVVGLIAVAVKLQPVPAPPALPAHAAAAVGPVDGTYQAGSGSVAGFRIQQTVLGLTSDIVGRTKDVTGNATIAGGQVTTADLRLGLLALTSGDAKPAPQFGISLDTRRYPDATVSLTRPVTLDAAFTSGTTVTVDAAGTLALHGVTHTVTVPLSVRRDGTSIEIAGSVPVAFADYGITEPAGYGGLGSLADHGVAEFLLVLHRS